MKQRAGPMSHLTPETLARLVDEPASGEEESHLTACPGCRREMEALRQQREMLAALPNMMPAPDQWATIRQRLRAEGLARSPGRWWRSPALTRAAAAAALFVGGAGAGWVAHGLPAGPRAAPSSAMVADGRADGASSPADGRTFAADGQEAASPRVTTLADAASGDAADDVEQAEQAFRAALNRYMGQNSTTAADPAARLAALDNIVLTTAEALKAAPADPVINGYYLTAVAQRDAVLRQISAGEPVF